MNKTKRCFVFDDGINQNWMEAEPPTVRHAVLKDYRLGFCGNMVTLVPCKGRMVEGLICKLSLEKEEAMDWGKGYPGGLYEKQEVIVKGKDNTGYRVMVYVPDRIASMHHALPSAEYFGRMVEGYCQHGFQTKELFESLKDTERDMMKLEAKLRGAMVKKKNIER